MYYIYHIPGKKIGMTTNLENRVEKQQGYHKSEYLIIHKTLDVEEASDMERQFQELFKYKQDEDMYEEITRINATEQTSTFPVPLSDLERFLRTNLDHEWETLHGKFKIDEQSIRWIMENSMTSKFREDRCYVYNKSLANHFFKRRGKKQVSETKPMMVMPDWIDPSFGKTEKITKPNYIIFDLIRDWAQERGLYDKGDLKTQYCKLGEEFGELGRAIIKNDEGGVIDSIGDIVVVLTNVAELASNHFNEDNLTIEYCIEEAYNEIKNRKGGMKNGSFIKETL